MHTNEPKQDLLVDLGYETRDLNVKAIRNATVGFFIFGVLCFGGVLVWFIWFKPKMGFDRDARKVAGPPVPLIQSNIATKIDIMAMRKHETQMLSTYGKNPDGSVRIPIDRAIDIVAAHGIASTGQQVPAVSPGNTIKQNGLQPATAVPAPTPDVVP
jgi:hypothetical protein